MQIPQLTFLRFIAAIAVVMFHFGGQTAPLSSDWLFPLVAQGGLGVGFFFTLSGFLLAWVYGLQEKIEWKPYFQARFARIAPIYWFSFVLALVLWMTLRDLRPRGLSIILQTLGLQAWVPDYSLTLNFPGWSVSVELFLYCTLPILLWALRGRDLWVWLTVGLVAWGLGTWQFLTCAKWSEGWFQDPNADFVIRWPLWHLPTFVVGVCGGLILLRYPRFLGGWKWTPSLVMLACTFAFVLLCFVPNPIIPKATNGLLAPLFLLMILALSQDKGPVAKLLERKQLVFLGEISYSIYLLQCPVYLIFEWWEAEKGITGVHGGMFWAYLLTLIVASAAAYSLIEKPARAWLRGVKPNVTTR